MAFVLAETEVQEPDESLAAEVAPFGADTILVEPGIARTATAEGSYCSPPVSHGGLVATLSATIGA